jgi:hypothetical protein
LLASVPQLHRKWTELGAVEGEPRTRVQTSESDAPTPPLVQIEADHFAAIDTGERAT